MGTLEHKVAIVTGGASGIGRAIALRCAVEGARVVIGDVQDGAAVIASADAGDGRVVFRRADVSRAADVADLVQHAVDTYRRLDVLVCAAGISGGIGAIADYSEADFDRVIAIDLKGVFLCMKYAIPQMLRAGGGAIVNIASIAGMVGLARTPAYSAAKAGVVQLTKVAALDYADRNIRVNCVCPGMIDTPMVQRIGVEAQQQFIARQPLRRLGTADEIAAAAVFLASDASAFTTGAALVVDGGFTAQ
jgi:NAD(P)-dependent dehydrogenase (short-subunit alcohol dehydrogenase family)